jgi:hypothetical protein
MMLLKPLLQVDCDDEGHQWSLLFDGEHAVRLTYDGQADEPEEGIIAAELVDPRQLSALIERICDYHDQDAHALATEIFDLLLTLAPMKPSQDCIDFLVWRIREWICDNRRDGWSESNVA